MTVPPLAAELTAEVIARMADTADPRLKAVMASLVRHLHDFAREVSLTSAEWVRAVDFLTRTGRICTDRRQEFILLSDVLGLSMLVDAIAHSRPDGATDTTVLGPFFVEGQPDTPNGTDIARGIAGQALFISGTVCGPEGAPVQGASVDIWHSDQEGFYDVQRPALEGAALRARFTTDQAGRFWFWSIMPRHYPIPDDGPVGELLAVTGRHPYRPAHVHFLIGAESHETLVTHVFAAGDAYLESDAVFGVKPSLIDLFPEQPPGAAPDGRRMEAPWRLLRYDFTLRRV